MTLKLITQQVLGNLLVARSSVSGPDKAVLIASKKKCKCGSTTHLRTIVTESGDPMNIRIRGDSIGNSLKKLLRKSADLVLPLTFVLAIKTVQSIQVSKLHPLPGKWLLVHVVYTKSTQQIFFVRDFIMSQY